MKRPLALLLGLSMILCTGCAKPIEMPHMAAIEFNHDPNDQTYRTDGPYGAYALFESTLTVDENGHFIFPDSFGGCFYDLDSNMLVFWITSDDCSEYQYLADEFDCVEFRKADYSYNYLQGLVDDYIKNYRGIEEVYGGGVDEFNNRAFITVSAKTLSQKTNDKNSPIIFVEGSPAIGL